MKFKLDENLPVSSAGRRAVRHHRAALRPEKRPDPSRLADRGRRRLHDLHHPPGRDHRVRGSPRLQAGARRRPGTLAAVEGGGAMALLADRLGYVQLAEPVRFTAAWERAASLRLRQGDATALDDYDQHGRICGAPPGGQPCLPGLEIGATCGGHHALLGTLRSLTQCIRLYFSGRQGWVRSRAQLRLFGRGGLLVPETRRLGQLPARRRIWPGCRLWRCSRKALGDLSVAEIAGMYPACSAAAPIILPEPISVTPVFAVIALAGDARCPPGSPNSRSRNQGPRPAPRQPQARHRA